MRATHLLAVGGLVLLLGGCSKTEKKGGQAPPPLKKELLVGKWKNASATALVTGYEFDANGKLKMIVQGMKQPVTGRYTWSGDRALDLEYDSSAEVKKAYAAAVKAYKDKFLENIKKRGIPGQAANSLSAIPDELPGKETLRVSIGEGPPVELFLTDPKGTLQTYQKEG